MALTFKKFFSKRKKVDKKTQPISQTTDQVKAEAKIPSKPVKGKIKTHIAKRPSNVIYKVLKQALISEKTTDLNEKGQYVFLTAKNANKNQIKQAVSDLFGVKVARVRTVNISAKPRVWRGHRGVRHGLEHGYKKAIVSLAQGEKIEVLPR